MHKTMIFLIIIFCLLPVVTAVEYVPGVIYVKYKSVQDTDRIKDNNQNVGFEKVLAAKPFIPKSKDVRKEAIKEQIGLDRWVKISIPLDADPFVEAEKYSELANVVEAHAIEKTELLLIPNDPRIGGEMQWYHNNPGGVYGSANPGGEDVDSYRAWDIITGTGMISNADTYVEWFHSDLAQTVWQNLGEDIDGDGSVIEFQTDVGAYVLDSQLGNYVWDPSFDRYVFDPDDVNGIDDDGNGYIDDFIGWNFVSDNNDPTPRTYDISSNDQHGTTTSGVIVATANNSNFIAGMCWNCRLVATAGLGVYFPEAIVYAIDNGARVVTMSWTANPTGVLLDTLNYALANDVFLVAAGGNTYETSDSNPLCKADFVMCVAATNVWDSFFSWSNTGNDLDVGAPGGMHVLLPGNRMNYNTGSSLSSPLVGGIASLIIDVNPALTTQEVFSIIQSSTEPFHAPNRYGGNGRVNAYYALLLAQESLINNGFPIAMINSQQTMVNGNTLAVWGNAKSNNYDRTELYLGTGLYPSIWELQDTISSQKSDELIFGYDVSSLAFGTYTIKLVTYDLNGQSANDTYLFTRTPLNLPNWPIASGGSALTPLVGDVTGDGNNEIIYVDLAVSKILIRDINSNLLAEHSIAGYIVATDISLADLNNDGAMEIIIPLTNHFAQSSEIRVIDYLGNSLNGFPLAVQNRVIGSVAIANVDLDDDLELIFSGFDKKLHAVNHDGTYVTSFPFDIAGAIQNTPVVADFDNDGDKEILIQSVDMKMYIYSLEGILEVGPILFGATMYSAPAVADLDNDQDLEIAFQNADKLYLIDHLGNTLSGWPVNVGITQTINPNIADLDGDGILEIIAASDKIQAYNIDGSAVFTPVDYQGAVYSSIVANIDSDTELEIITQNGAGIVVALNHDGTIVPGWEIDLDYSIGKQLAAYDIKKDGTTQILVGGQRISIYDTGFQYLEGYPMYAYSTLRNNLLNLATPQPNGYDLNGDGQIGITDANLLTTYFGNQGYQTTGDFNNDSIVNVLDLIDLLANLGN